MTSVTTPSRRALNSQCGYVRWVVNPPDSRCAMTSTASHGRTRTSTSSVGRGRPRWDPASADVDLMVRPQDAEGAQAALVEEGFEAVPTTDEHWLRKVERDGVGVDLIFRAAGDIYLDEDMIERVVERDFE